MELTIYRYLFKPKVDKQNLFYEHASQYVKQHKNTVFREAILKCRFIHRNRELSKQIVYDRDNIIVLKLANKKSIIREKNFEEEKLLNEPSIHVIIHNNPHIQKIAIEQKVTAFSETDTVKNIIKRSINQFLLEHQTLIDIRQTYQEVEFWNIVNRHKNKITYICFEFDYPNLPSAFTKATEMLKSLSQSVNSKSNKLALEAAKNETLIIGKNNVQIQELNAASSQMGNTTTIRVKGIKKQIKTGQTIETITYDDVEITGSNISEIIKMIE